MNLQCDKCGSENAWNNHQQIALYIDQRIQLNFNPREIRLSSPPSITTPTLDTIWPKEEEKLNNYIHSLINSSMVSSPFCGHICWPVVVLSHPPPPPPTSPPPIMKKVYFAVNAKQGTLTENNFYGDTPHSGRAGRGASQRQPLCYLLIVIVIRGCIGKPK